ncbi:hypothetical protein MBH78_02365 [Oceanimonas sp. NS1]|nr:hypothetical protein [Oceanimonas sp. NS1]
MFGLAFEIRRQLLQALPGRVGLDDNGAIVGADGAHPAGVIHVQIPAELAQGQVEGRAGAERHHGVVVFTAVAVHVGVGHGAHATGHKGHSHRLIEQAGLVQAVGQNAAGQVKTTARLGRRNALRLVGGKFGTGGTRHHQQAGAQQGFGQGMQLHNSSPCLGFHGTLSAR